MTGAPGSGKSTLVDRLTSAIRAKAQTVGVVAVDPSSPFTGGAILGDRVRMQAHAGDAGVFIRSMATRGHLGGLSRSAGGIALLLDAGGGGGGVGWRGGGGPGRGGTPCPPPRAGG